MRRVFFFLLFGRVAELSLLVINLAETKKENSKTKIVPLVNRSRHSFNRKNYYSNANKFKRSSKAWSYILILADLAWQEVVFRDN